MSRNRQTALSGRDPEGPGGSSRQREAPSGTVGVRWTPPSKYSAVLAPDSPRTRGHGGSAARTGVVMGAAPELLGAWAYAAYCSQKPSTRTSVNRRRSTFIGTALASDVTGSPEVPAVPVRGAEAVQRHSRAPLALPTRRKTFGVPPGLLVPRICGTRRSRSRMGATRRAAAHLTDPAPLAALTPGGDTNLAAPSGRGERVAGAVSGRRWIAPGALLSVGTFGRRSGASVWLLPG